MRLRLFLLLVTCCTALLGCSRDTPDYMLNDYVERLSNTLEVDRIPSTPNLLPLFPPRRDRIMEPTEIRQGLVEVLDLQICDLLPLIAERNSSLGKVYTPSKRMVYELKFFHGLRECRKKIQSGNDVTPELQKKIERIYQIKKDNLAQELWNGLYLAKEFEDNFSRGEPALAKEPTGSSQASYNALFRLSQLTHMLKQDDWALPDDIDRLETQYQTLHQNRSGGQIFQSINLLTHYLTEAATLINARLDRKDMCPLRQATPQARILKNVFQKYYAQRVQPYLAYAHQQALQWTSLNNLLLDEFKQLGIVIPKSMENYQQTMLSQTAKDGLWLRYIHARDKHTSAWQRILKQCDLMPRSQ
mgnify:CR=1 FL=1